MSNERLAAKVQAVNLAHAEAQKLYKALRLVFEPLVGQQVKKAMNDDLLARVDKLVRAYTDVPEVSRDVRICRQQSSYSLVWEVTASAPIGDPNGLHTVVVHKAVVYIGNMDGSVLASLTDPPDFRTDYTAEEIVAKRKVCEDAKKAFERARNDLCPFGEFDQL